MHQAATQVHTAFEQQQEYGLYDIMWGQFHLVTGPAGRDICEEIAAQFPKDIPIYILPFAGNYIGTEAIDQLIADQHLPPGFTFPPVQYCQRCRRDMDTVERNDRQVCVICYTPTQPK